APAPRPAPGAAVGEPTDDAGPPGTGGLGRAVRRTRPSDRAGLRADGGERGRGRRDLRAPGRAATGHRAGRGAHPGAAAAGDAGTARGPPGAAPPVRPRPPAP